jgi:hypothetical protein
VLAVALAVLLAGAAHPARLAVERVVVPDRSGDPEDGNYKRWPARLDLDARSVTVERRGKALRIIWETVARASAPVIYAFNAFDSAGNQVAAIEVRIRPGGSVGGYASKTLGSYANTIPRDSIRVRGRRTIVDVAPSFVTYARRFDWSASVATIGRSTEIRDDVPNPGKSVLEPLSAKFP